MKSFEKFTSSTEGHEIENGDTTPKAFGVLTVLKLGKAITKINSSFLNVELSEFDISSRGWSKPTAVKLRVEDNAFASTGFHQGCIPFSLKPIKVKQRVWSTCYIIYEFT